MSVAKKSKVKAGGLADDVAEKKAKTITALRAEGDWPEFCRLVYDALTNKVLTAQELDDIDSDEWDQDGPDCMSLAFWITCKIKTGQWPVPKGDLFIYPETQPKGGTGKSLTTKKSGSLEFHKKKSPNGIATSYMNAKIGIEKLGADCRYDIFHDRLIVAGFECSGSGDATENLDNVSLKVRDRIIQKYKFDPGKNHILDAIVSVALDHAFDPVVDYLDSLRWDGEPRLDTWLIDHMGVDDNKLNRAIGRKMLMAAVRRARRPGVKFDYIVVLEGEQGSGRSTALKILAGEENFSDAEIINLWPKERQEMIQGVWIYELAEMAGYDKQDINKFKNFVSQTIDRARPAFGRTRIDRPRRCILVGTTNDEDYLRDYTGNRRYWPVKLPKGWRIDLDEFAAVRDQLWAEAVVMEAMVDGRGRQEQLVIPEELWPEAAIAQAARLAPDPWSDQLVEMFFEGEPREEYKDILDDTQADNNGNPEWRISSADLLTRVLGIPVARQHQNHSRRLAKAMRQLGWDKPDKPFRICGKVGNGYRRPRDPLALPAPKVAKSAAKPKLAVVQAPTDAPVVGLRRRPLW